MDKHPDDLLTGDGDPFKGDPNFMASLARGLEVIQAFTPQRPLLSISQISQKTGIPRAAVRRCLLPADGLGRMKASVRWESSSMRVLSPRMEPPVTLDDGSTASTATPAVMSRRVSPESTGWPTAAGVAGCGVAIRCRSLSKVPFSVSTTPRRAACLLQAGASRRRWRWQGGGRLRWRRGLIGRGRRHGRWRRCVAKLQRAFLAEGHGQAEEQAVGGEEADRRAHLREHAEPGALALRCILSGQQRRAAPFSPQAQALTETQHAQQDRRPGPDAVIAGQ